MIEHFIIVIVYLVLCALIFCCYCNIRMEGLTLRQPAEMVFEGNVSDNWKRFRRNFENYLLAINLQLRTKANPEDPEPAENAGISKRQIALLMHIAGDEANEIFAQLEVPDGKSKENLIDVLDMFDTYCNPRRNELYEWYVFWTMSQSHSEPIDSYLKRLKSQALKCDFPADVKPRMLLCRVVFGLSSIKMKERMLRDNTMTLERAINEIRAAEMTESHMNLIADGDKTGVARSVAAVDGTSKSEEKSKCKFCPYEHVYGKCPAYGKKCKRCGGMNHFAKKCNKKAVQSVETEVEAASDQSKTMATLFIGTVDSDRTKRSWFIDLCIGENLKNTSFKVDTGAEVNTITESLVKILNVDIKPSKVKLLGYNKSVIPNIGYVVLPAGQPGKGQQLLRFEVVKSHLVPVLGLEACVSLGVVNQVNEVITAEHILDNFPDVFEGLGCLAGEHEIRIDESVKPVVHAPRRVPISMNDRVKAELDRMEATGVIKKVDVPTQWVNSMVCVEKKNGSVRICLDPRDLNKAVLREHHKIPTLEDIAFRFSGMKHFTILDMKHGYWHICLSEKSSLLTTFNTPFGRYCYRRLPFGLHSSAEVFEKRVEQVFGDLNVSIYFDDIIVAGKTQQEHDDNLRQLLQRAREHNVRFNRDKIQLNQTEVNYLGHIVSAEGLKPDPSKVQAISDMPNPTDKAGIQRLMGTLNFLRSYIPKMSTLTEPLRCLLKQDVAWHWGPEQNKSMEIIKRVLLSEQVLKYFDVSKEVSLQVDASQCGLGAVLLQEGRPVAYASRALTTTEINYPQIDKELLAIVFGCEYFHNYIYGQPVAIQTDHKPLLSIVKKPLHRASPRMQRLLLRLQRYEVGSISYVPGKHLYLADTLSRAYLQDCGSKQTDLEDEVVMVHTLEVADELSEWLVTAYDEDTTMKDLKHATLNGWNWTHKSNAPANIQPFWAVRDELYELDGFLYVGERLVIPAAARKRVLEMIHQGHMGIEKCKERARRGVYWPGMNNDIQVKVSSCSHCAIFGNQQAKEPLVPHDIPELPWYTLAMDIMEFQGMNYLVVVDCMSHYPELRQMKGKTANHVVMALKSIFAVHGVPMSVFADNMPFSSQQMLIFAKDWGFTIKTSSPHHHKSNGLAERYVQTIKQFMKKCESSGEDIYRSLLAYRDTPVSGCFYSPAEMLFSRVIRSGLPVTSESLKPAIVSPTDQLRANQRVTKETYDKSAKALPNLNPGMPVFVRTDQQKEWTPGQIIDRHTAPRSYVVDVGKSVVRRNRVHLKPNYTTTTTLNDDAIPTDGPPATTYNRSEMGPICDKDAGHSSPSKSRMHTRTDDVATTPLQRPVRQTRGSLPSRFKDYVME